MDMDRERLRQQLIRHEGVKVRPYYDSKSYLSIGVGRNLETVGISVDEAKYLLGNDIDRAIHALASYAWFPALDAVRQAALVNLMFNIGPKSFAGFKRMIAALQRSDYGTAALEMLDSQWSHEVGSRATELAEQMRSGAWQV